MPDQKLSLGEYLRTEREKRGLSVEQVASATKIGVRLLHSLETDHYSDLPAKPFIRGFVISYCRFIGMDPKETLNQFDEFISKKALERPSRESGHSGYVFEKREGDQSRTFLWTVLVAFVLFGGFAAVFLKKPSHRHKNPSHIEKLREAYGTPAPKPSAEVTLVAAAPVAAPSQTEKKPVEKPIEKTKEAVKVEAPPAPAPSVVAPVREAKSLPKEPLSDPNDPLNSGKTLKNAEIHQKIVIKALANVWVRYQVDRRPPMRFILRKDSVLVLRATDAIRFQTSNPGMVLYNYNGAGNRPLTEAKNLTARYGGGTLFVPTQPAENTDDPFSSWGPIPTSEPPPSPKQAGLSTDH